MKVDGRHRPMVDGLPRNGVEAVVLKWEIEVDDQTHQVQWPADAQVVHVAPHPERVDAVWVWTLSTRHTDGSRDYTRFRWIRVYATEDPIPTPCVHLGTAVTRFGLVWHLVELI